MDSKIQNGHILVHRANILDGLRALNLAQNRFDRFLKEETYACGYKEGFEDALLAMAQMMGVAEEFEATNRRIKTYMPEPSAAVTNHAHP